MSAEQSQGGDRPTVSGETSRGDLEDAYRRRDAYGSSLDASLKEREDLIAKRTRSTNASAISKIRKIYELVDELGAAAKDFVACKNGCAACCHMNVMISAIEAKHIEAATGETACGSTVEPDSRSDRVQRTALPVSERFLMQHL